MANRPPRVAIVTAAYNVEREIAVLLESLARSEFRDFEFCCCVDGSTDRTAAVIEGFRAPFQVRLVRHSENRGVTAARNSALALAQAPLLVFLDADVVVEPDTLARLVVSLERSKADVLCGIYAAKPVGGGLFARVYALFVHHSFLGGRGPYNVFNAWCAIARREVFDRLGGHRVVAKGVEIENEALGRRIVAAGYSLILDPDIALAHSPRDIRKLWFIFTSRVYWWVKVFFAGDRRFESALTTRGYAAGTLCAPVALVLLVFAPDGECWRAATFASTGGFLWAYGPFLAFARKAEGASFTALCAILLFAWAIPAAVCAVYSGVEELARLSLGRGTTLDAAQFEL